jgi:hypothetical protein
MTRGSRPPPPRLASVSSRTSPSWPAPSGTTSKADRYQAGRKQLGHRSGAAPGAPTIPIWRRSPPRRLAPLDVIFPRFDGQSDYAAKRFIRIFNSNSIGLT